MVTLVRPSCSGKRCKQLEQRVDHLVRLKLGMRLSSIGVFQFYGLLLGHLNETLHLPIPISGVGGGDSACQNCRSEWCLGGLRGDGELCRASLLCAGPLCALKSLMVFAISLCNDLHRLCLPCVRCFLAGRIERACKTHWREEAAFEA